MSSFSKESLRRTLSKELNQSLSEQVDRAFELAYRAHSDQYREQRDARSKKVPYIVHPIGVARIATELLHHVSLRDSFDDLISTCLTHDVLEDSEVTPQELADATSPRTAELVFALTKPTFTGDVQHVDRNQLFLQKITHGGPTASFVKICDHIHNLSRPTSMPIRLLEKAVHKGNYYIQLFENDLLPSSLKIEYLNRLKAAQLALEEYKASDMAAPKKWSLSEAIEYCVETTKHKILEQHDIADAIATVTNAEYARLSVNNEFLAKLEKSLVGIDQKIRQQILTAIDFGELDCGLLPASARVLTYFSVDLIYILDVSRYTKCDAGTRLFVGIKRGVGADWTSVPTLQMLTGYLCERLSSHERSRINALALDLARNRIDVDLDDALRLHFGPSDLKDFRALLDQAEFVRGKLVHALEYHLREGRLHKDLPIISSRIKSPRSISKKMLLQALAALSNVSDVLGIRIVCRSKYEALKIADRARKVILDELAALTTLDEIAISINISESNAGYRALHISFAVPPSSISPNALGCEIQIRTVFQDAWARVSHDLDYKSDQTPSEKVRYVLQQLADFRDKSDQLLEQLD